MIHLHIKVSAQYLTHSTHSIISYYHQLVIHFLSRYGLFKGVLIIAVLDTECWVPPQSFFLFICLEFWNV